MKHLKLFLIAVYVVIIILLLLSLHRCKPERHKEEKVEQRFDADVVMCIDCTGSMTGLIRTVKENAMHFYSDLTESCKKKGKDVSSMRIRIIAFRDVTEGASTSSSPFYAMPDQQRQLNAFISCLSAEGGYDYPESGYDTLSEAFQSDWRNSGNVRQVVILWTDAPSHPLTSRTPGPRSFNELAALWNENVANKRLVIFAPECPSWTNVTTCLKNSIQCNVAAGTGLSSLEYEEIIRNLADFI